MKDFEEQAYKLVISIKTRHNEVAPNQFECATVYEEANMAADHNILLMTIMNKVAPKHHLQVIFHEKSDLRVTDIASNGCKRHTKEA